MKQHLPDRIDEFLIQHRDDHDMKVPDGYFDNIEKNVLSKAYDDKPIDLNKWRNLIPTAAAAMIIIGLGIWTALYLQEDIPEVVDESTEMSYEEMTVSDYYVEVGEADLLLDDVIILEF